MMNNWFGGYGYRMMGWNYDGTGLLIMALVIWELVWKGMGLWKAAQRKEKEWFIAMLIFSTAGLLPIAYLNWWIKRGKGKGKK